MDKKAVQEALVQVLVSAKCVKENDCQYTAPPNYSDKEKYPDDDKIIPPYIKQ